jgi:hypothetical protein
MMRQSRRGNVTRHFDCRYVHKDGRTILLTWNGKWSEKAQQHFFIGRDITEARALEEIKEKLAGIDDPASKLVLEQDDFKAGRLLLGNGIDYSTRLSVGLLGASDWAK